MGILLLPKTGYFYIEKAPWGPGVCHNDPEPGQNQTDAGSISLILAWFWLIMAHGYNER